MKIYESKEWLDECEELIDEKLREVSRHMINKYGLQVPFPMFLHLCLTKSIQNIYSFAPSVKEAERFIKKSHAEFKNLLN